MNTVVLNRILSGSASLALLLLASGNPVCAAGSEGAPSLPEARETGEAGWRYRVACHSRGKSLGPSIAALSAKPEAAPSRSVTANTREVSSSSIHQTNPI